MFHLFVLVFPTISNCSIVLSNGPKQLTNISKRKPLGMPENKVTCFVWTFLYFIYFCISQNCATVKILYSLYMRILSNWQCDKILRKSYSFCSLLGFNTISLAVCISAYKQTQTRQISVGNDLPERLISQGGQIGYIRLI